MPGVGPERGKEGNRLESAWQTPPHSKLARRPAESDYPYPWSCRRTQRQPYGPTHPTACSRAPTHTRTHTHQNTPRITLVPSNHQTLDPQILHPQQQDVPVRGTHLRLAGAWPGKVRVRDGVVGGRLDADGVRRPVRFRLGVHDAGRRAGPSGARAGASQGWAEIGRKREGEARLHPRQPALRLIKATPSNPESSRRRLQPASRR
eukprot:1619421-Rhodomonas_salina.3